MPDPTPTRAEWDYAWAALAVRETLRRVVGVGLG